MITLPASENEGFSRSSKNCSDYQEPTSTPIRAWLGAKGSNPSVDQFGTNQASPTGPSPALGATPSDTHVFAHAFPGLRSSLFSHHCSGWTQRQSL
ncbi:MAG: hypothetical protein KME35_17250 [Aphanocapsa sp. GSE-SYN-MK-11-07L]|nr:hypothetical protein [Aphanocapsa sp. GSE-SYN-MK-11-07L]